MKTLKNWLINKGFFYTDATFGANYFNDHSLDLHFEGAAIALSNNEHRAYKEIERYCNRYGYAIISKGGFPGVAFYHIMRRDQWQELENYNKYSRKAVEQCNKHIHFCNEYYGQGNHREINEELSGIMEFYEDEYKAFLAA